MSNSPYGFVAFIDEAGDEGFTFRDHPKRGSSQWFVLSAVVIRESHRTIESRSFQTLSNDLKIKWEKLHFRNLPHEKRAAITHYLSRRPIRIISVCWNKRCIAEDGKPHTLDQLSKLHHYSIRLLIERISWLAWFHRDERAPLQCKLVFAKCKNLKYSALKNYLSHLRSVNTRIRWNTMDAEKIIVKPSSELIGLKMADVAASGVYRGLELDPYGRTEPAYCGHLKRITFEHNGRYLGYGLKIMPTIPEVEPQFDGRYSWIEQYK